MEVMQDLSEIVRYNRRDVPIYIQTDLLSTYTDMRAICHWHEDLEFIHILSGEMYYYVNGKQILLKEMDTLVVNSRQMHYGYSHARRECKFICIVFHPQLFQSCRKLYQEFVKLIINDVSLEYFYFDASSDVPDIPKSDLFSLKENGVNPSIASDSEQNLAFLQIGNLIRQVVACKESNTPAHELQILGIMNILWSRIYEERAHNACKSSQEQDQNHTIQKSMVSYIYQHYSEKLTLEDIAASGNVCRSKCCQLFKLYTRQSPIDFLNTYRLKVSCNLLTTTDLSITQISLDCGFNHLSYYSKLFFRTFGCTPKEFRRH